MGRPRKYKKKKASEKETETEVAAVTEVTESEKETQNDMAADTEVAATEKETETEVEPDHESAEAGADQTTVHDDVEEEIRDDEDIENEPPKKKKRGPTKMKDIAKDPNDRIRVDFTRSGAPYGPGSVKLSSYLGTLVREHVPYTIDDWRKVGDDIRTVLWKSVQARFALDQDFQKNAVLSQMGCLWRSSKSRLVTKIRKLSNRQERMRLRPSNVRPGDWASFVKRKTSPAFKAVSDESR